MSTQGKFAPITNPNMDPPKISHTQDLDEIKDKIISLQNDVEKSYLEIGRLLLKAKEINGKHGEWLGWVQENVDLSVCKVERLMRVARWIDKNEAPVQGLTFTQAYLLCKMSQQQLAEFGDFINGLDKVKDMTKRELEAKIREFLKWKNGKSSTAQVSQQAEPQTSTKDGLSERFDRIRNDVSELASIINGTSGLYDTFASELCEVCQTILQQLLPEDVENI